MKDIKFLLIVISIIQAVGCTSAEIKPLASVDDSAKSTVTIYRVRAYAAWGKKCIVGIDGFDRFVLKNKQSTTVELRAERHEIYVRDDKTQRASAITITIDSESGQMDCYKVFPNPDTMTRMLLGNLIAPGVTLPGRAFVIEHTVCSKADLDEYTPVTVEYR